MELVNMWVLKNTRTNIKRGSLNRGIHLGTVFAFGLNPEPMMPENTDIEILNEFFESPEIDETYLEHMMHKRNTASDKAQLLTPSDVTWRHVARFFANLARGNRRFG